MADMKIGSSLMGRVIKFFKEDDWRFTEVEGQTALRLGVNGENASYSCFARVREEQCQFVFYTIMDTKIPEGKRQAVADYLTRANYGMPLGNFEMDFSDGEVRSKNSISVIDSVDSLTSPLIKKIVYSTIVMMDKYYPGIMAVVFGGKSPEESIREIEK